MPFFRPWFLPVARMVGTVGTVGTSHLFAERVTISIKRHHSLFIGVKCVHTKKMRLFTWSHTASDNLQTELLNPDPNCPPAFSHHCKEWPTAVQERSETQGSLSHP